jgi:DNA-binding NarL/FixJ family response regulator
MHRAKNFSDVAERLPALTERQKQVATLVCGGLSNRTIAEKLGVSEGTVKEPGVLMQRPDRIVF